MSQADIKRAEKAAVAYLEMRGFQIIEQGWTRPRARVDIIARKNGVIHFVEVVYRPDTKLHDRLEVATSSKYLRLQSSAWAWVEQNKYSGKYVHSSVEITNPGFAVTGFIEGVL